MTSQLTRINAFFLCLVSILASHTMAGEPSNRNWALNASLSYGSDDNVISFVDESETNPNSDGSASDTSQAGSQNFTEFSLTPMWFSSNDFRSNWVFDAMVFNSEYEQASDYNIRVFGVGGRKNLPLNPHNTLALSLRADRSAVGEEDYLRSVYYEIANRYKTRQGFLLKTGLRWQQSEALDDQYQPFEGNTARLYGDITQKLGRHRLRLRIQADDEDKGSRGDATLGEDVSHFSVSRMGIKGSWAYHANHWRSNISYHFRDSRFKDDYISFLNDETLGHCIAAQQRLGLCSVDSRNDERHSWAAMVGKDFGEQWYLEAEWRQVENTSSIDRFSYDNQIVSLSIGWQI